VERPQRILAEVKIKQVFDTLWRGRDVTHEWNIEVTLIMIWASYDFRRILPSHQWRLLRLREQVTRAEYRMLMWLEHNKSTKVWQFRDIIRVAGSFVYALVHSVDPTFIACCYLASDTCFGLDLACGSHASTPDILGTIVVVEEGRLLVALVSDGDTFSRTAETT
jgi:hypothetical protein